MKLNVPMNVQGNCHAILRDQEGKIKQEVYGHNVICKNALARAIQGDTYSTLDFQVGTGTTAPAYSDTSLTQKIYSGAITSIGSYTIQRLDGCDTPGTQCIIHVVLPATASCVGDITEFGLSRNNYLRTHGLFYDEQGTPRVIPKTANDTLEVTYTITLYIQATAPWYYKGTNCNQDFTYIWLRCLLGEAGQGNSWILKCSKMLGTNMYSAYTRTSPYSLTRTVDANAGTIRFNGSLRLLSNEGDPGWYRAMSLVYLETYSASYQWGSDSGLYCDLSEIFEAQKMEGLSIGVGDGVTAAFEPPIDFWVQDSETIYINDTALTRGVDYSCSNLTHLHNYPELSIPWDDITILTTSGFTNTKPMVPLTSSGYAGWDFSQYQTGMKYPEPVYGTAVYSVNGMKWPARAYMIYDLSKNIIVSSVNFCRRDGRLSLYYSTDNVSWTKIPFSTSGSGNTQYNFTSPVTMRYLKFINETNNDYEYTVGSYGTVGGLQFSLIPYQATRETIVFTTPPAVGDAISMDAYTPLPFKNDKHYFDMAVDITFTLTATDS